MKNDTLMTSDESLVLSVLSDFLNNEKVAPTATQIALRTPYTSNYVSTVLVSLKKRNKITYVTGSRGERLHALS